MPLSETEARFTRLLKAALPPELAFSATQKNSQLRLDFGTLGMTQSSKVMQAASTHLPRELQGHVVLVNAGKEIPVISYGTQQGIQL